MRKAANLLLSAAVALALVAFSSADANAQEHKKPKGEQVSLANAQVIDLHCYTANGMKGDMHKECAIACAKAGVPLALLSSDGKIYVPVSKQPMVGQSNLTKKLQDNAEGFVNVKGTAYESGGILTIDISEVSKT